MTEHPMTEATPLASEQITQPKKLKPQYPDYLDDPDGLARFRDQVCHQNGHDMAICNNNSLGRLIDTIERLRAERDAALSASPAPSGQDVSGEVVLWTAVQAGKKFLADCNAAWAAGEPSHRVRTMLDSADKFQTALDSIDVEPPAPAPSCAPGEVERLRAEFARLHEAARGCEFDLTPADGPIARLTLFVHQNGDAILAALSPQGLDAKEGGE